MKITPLEIRQKDFEKKLRGYDKDEVNAFLLSLSNEWERVLDENKELNIKLQHANKEVEKLRQVESSLYKTLKTAEDTGANMIDQANKAAELHMKETQMNAEGLLSESKSKARAMIEKAEMEARQIIEELQDAVKVIEQNHRDIESHRQIAISELKNLSVTLIEKVERSSGETKEFKFDNYVKRVKELARDSDEKIKAEKTEVEAVFKKIDTPSIEERIAEDNAEEQPKQKPIEPIRNEEEVNIEKVVEPKPEKIVEPKIEVKQEPVLVEKSPDTEPEITKEEPKIKEVAFGNSEPRKVKQVIRKRRRKEASQGGSTDPSPKEEEKKGPKISRTVSFFDQLDTDS
ncbi:MAG: DivIVA domain-containing protein [Ekhidna sp.]